MLINPQDLPWKTITIKDFKARTLESQDYTFNSEFEQSYKRLFDKQFRAITFRLEDADWLCSRIFQIAPTKNLDHFCEFNRYNKKDSEITIVVQYDDWYNFNEFEFRYVFLHSDIIEIDNQIKELQNLREQKIKEINANH
jgi:hypothetical protein